MHISVKHPRYQSLLIREKLLQGINLGITSSNGLIAHGRGEAFDYLLGERTHDFAMQAITAAALQLCVAKHPVISVNGNTAALIPEALITLSEIVQAPLEINLFHRSEKREQLIKAWLYKHSATSVLLPDNTVIKSIASPRKYVHSKGIAYADVVFSPLEDGDKAENLVKLGKKVITVDLNPLSRTAQMASITIVDNIVRAIPKLIKQVEEISKEKIEEASLDKAHYNNLKILQKARRAINIR